MDLLIYTVSLILLANLIVSYDNMYPHLKNKARAAMVLSIIVPIVTCVLAISTAEVRQEKFYSVKSFDDISFAEPADILVTTTKYQKWSVLYNDTFFTQIPKGK